jgi:hypothetical protein
MYQPTQFTKTPPVRNSISRWPWRRLRLIGLAFASVALSPSVQAVSPPPDGGYPNQNTAEGTDALFSLTSGFANTALGYRALFDDTTGHSNTAIGSLALFNNTSGAFNTANGVSALQSNTTGFNNTATGFSALPNNTTGFRNTANGFQALNFNTTGHSNTASGANTLFNNTTGFENTANGLNALDSNTTGSSNTASGAHALSFNTTGFSNAAHGAAALFSNTTGHGNTANGGSALQGNATGNNNTANGVGALIQITTGSNNIALGADAGADLRTGSNNNIVIGHRGIAGETKRIRIGKQGTQTATFIAGIFGATAPGGSAVLVNSAGKLGTTTSSKRFKEEIKPMGEASEALFALRPVSFRYKQEIDPEGIPQFGLGAEDVEKVDPALVIRDEQGKAYTVRYEAVNAMLLNEFLKAHRKTEDQQTAIAQLESTVARQDKAIDALTAHLMAQESQIQKVSALLEVDAPAARLAVNQ